MPVLIDFRLILIIVMLSFIFGHYFGSNQK